MGGLALGDRGGSAGGSGSPRLLGSGAPASVDKSPSSSSAALGLRLGGGGGGSSGGSSSEHQQRHIGSVPDDWPMYSSQPDDYIIGPSIGFGASSTVYQASFRPLNGRACAVKVIDLEAFGRDTDELRRETQLMSLSKHPNVLRVRGCWVEGSKLHIATRLMSSGSMLDIMRFGWSDGLDEIVIATVLRQALEGLNYLHINGWLHRDLKAANMLVDDDGTVLLGDFGVGVYLGEEPKSRATKGAKAEEKENIDEGWAEGKRKSFVGTVSLQLERDNETKKLTGTYEALLDGTRGRRAQRLRNQSRYLVVWHYCLGADTRQGTLFTATAGQGAHEDAARGPTHSRPHRWRTQVLQSL